MSVSRRTRHLSEARVLLDLEAPPWSSVRCQWKRLSLWSARDRCTLHELLRHEVPARPDGRRATRTRRSSIAMRGMRHATPSTLACRTPRREQLKQRLDPVERARGPVGTNRHADGLASSDSLVAQAAREESSGWRSPASPRAPRCARRAADRWRGRGVPQQLPQPAQGAIGHDHGAGGQRKGAGLYGQVRRAGTMAGTESDARR